MQVKDFTSFSDLMASQADKKKNVLIGNGLSIDFDRNIFSYDKLLEEADFGSDAEIIKKIFDGLGTSDFESAAQAISTSLLVAKSYNNDEHAERLENALVILKNGLIRSVNNNHPASRHAIDDETALKLQIFLRNFLSSSGSVFCLNYDVLLYWSLLRRTELKPRLDFADGFSAISSDGAYVHFEGDQCIKNPNVMFPHGTLFLFEQGEYVSKPRANFANQPIIDIISSKFEEGIFPLFVSEGNSNQKMRRIRQSHYLNYCYERIGECEGKFLIHGHSLDTRSDGHILTKIASNPNIDSIYASFFGDENERQRVSLKIQEICTTARRSNITVGTYPSATAHCWR